MTTTENPIRNGVDTATLFATLDAVKGNPEIAKFQFRATNRWVSGTHNQSTIHGFYGAMQEMTHQQRPRLRRRPPGRPRRHRQRPDAGRVRAARPGRLPHRRAGQHRRRPRRQPDRGQSTVEGDIDLLGILGLSDDVRNGYQQIKVSFKLRGDDPEKLRQVVEQSRKRSAVFDIVTNGVPGRDRRRRRLNTPPDRPAARSARPVGAGRA